MKKNRYTPRNLSNYARFGYMPPKLLRVFARARVSIRALPVVPPPLPNLLFGGVQVRG